MNRYERPALIVGIVGIAASAIGAVVVTDQFFRSWMLSSLFWLAIALGALPLLMIHHLVGGKWGFAIRRILEAASRMLPLMAILFIPILFGIHRLYEWSHADVVAGDAVLKHKSSYLNVPFFASRAAFYFLVWIWFGWLLNRWSMEQDRTGHISILHRLQKLSGAGLVVYALTITFASTDWVMSLEPHWFSTIYGMMFMVGQVLTTLAFAVAILALLAETPPVSRFLTAETLNDLGNLLFAFIMLWAYLSFSQYLIIWSGNLPEEIPWYLRRSTGGWQWIAIALALFHFAVPFVLLLSGQIKRDRASLLRVVILLLHLLILVVSIAR